MKLAVAVAQDNVEVPGSGAIKIVLEVKQYVNI